MNREYNSYGRDLISIENLHFTPSVSGQELLKQGLQLLSQKNYKAAIQLLSRVIISDPSLTETYYYLAIALLSGKKPKKVDEWTIKEIEENLNLAIHKDSNPARCYAFWAIIKHGFYAMNGFIENPLTSSQLFSYGESIQAKDAKEILFHLDDPSNQYWLWLYNKFGKAH